MAYTIKNSRNVTVATIADGAKDETTNITLIGKNFLGYGTALNTDLYYMLENFASGTAPTKPVQGQLWYDTSVDDLKVYNTANSWVYAVKTANNLTLNNNLAVNGGTITSTAATANLLPANVTALNIGAAASTVNIGNTTGAGTTTVKGNLVVAQGDISFNTSTVVGIANATVVTLNVAGAASTVNIGYTGTTVNMLGTIQAGNIVVNNVNAAVMQNGTSNVAITNNGNITVGIAGNAAILTVTGTGANIAGTANITGNTAVGGNLTAIGNANVNNLGTGRVLASGNITTTQFISNIATGTAPLVVSSTTQVANLNVAVASSLINGTSNVVVAVNGDITVGSAGNAAILTVTGTGANISGTANVSGNANVGNLGTSTVIATTANLTTINGGLIQNGNSNVTITANANVSVFVTGNATARAVFTSTGANIAGTLNATGNANVGNLGTTTAIITTANATTINSGLLQNGTSNIAIAASGNVGISVGGTANSVVISGQALGVTGQFYSTGSNSGYYIKRRDTNADAYVMYSATGELRFYDAVGAADRLYLNAAGNLYPAGNATQQLGTTTNRWANVWGVASSAQYADLAEKYRSDADYEPGTVLEIGGEHEITVCNTAHSNRVFGCVSTDPAYLMNDSNKEGIWLPVVLTGRAPIRVAGPVNKGDRLVSAGNGAAMAANTFGSSYQTEIGRALESKTSEGVGLIEAYISTR